MSLSCSALYGGKTIFSSLRELLTRGSRNSVNFRSLEMPMTLTFAFLRSSLIRHRW